MSQEINGKVKILGHEIAGAYKKMFSAPIILEPCKHEIREEKSLLKKEIWIRTFHGKPNGATKLTVLCRKKGDVTFDYRR